MIADFEDQILKELTLEAECFDAEFAQWTYKFRQDGILLELIYSIDGSITTSLYVNDFLISFYFASGLQNLYMSNGKIHGEIVSGKLIRKIMINPINIEVKWQDS
jgi:hypothetical protein